MEEESYRASIPMPYILRNEILKLVPEQKYFAPKAVVLLTEAVIAHKESKESLLVKEEILLKELETTREKLEEIYKKEKEHQAKEGVMKTITINKIRFKQQIEDIWSLSTTKEINNYIKKLEEEWKTDSYYLNRIQRIKKTTLPGLIKTLEENRND